MPAQTANDILSPALEDYLEAILALAEKSRVARVRDIAKILEVGMSSVTAALKALSKRGLVNYDPYELVTLTQRGRELALGVSGRHAFLREFLKDVLGLDEATAEENACRMEHAADQAVLDRLHLFTKYVQDSPLARECIESFNLSLSAPEAPPSYGAYPADDVKEDMR